MAIVVADGDRDGACSSDLFCKVIVVGE